MIPLNSLIYDELDKLNWPWLFLYFRHSLVKY